MIGFCEGAFESGPANVQLSITNTANSDDTSTYLMAPSSSQLPWGFTTTSTSSSPAQKPPPVIQRAQSPNARSQPSNTKNLQSDTTGWVNPSEIGDGLSTTSSAVSSPAVMTKEEKALEMTRRKEERRQVCLNEYFQEQLHLIHSSELPC